MKQKANINLALYEIVWNNGQVEQFVLNGQQLAGMKRRKGFKKSYLTFKKIAVISVNIKTTL